MFGRFDLAVPPGLGRGGGLGREQLVQRRDAGQRALYVAAGGRVPLLVVAVRRLLVPRRAVLLLLAVVRVRGHDFLRLPAHLVLVQLEAGHHHGHDGGTGEHDEQRAEPVHRHAYAVHHVLADPPLEYGHRVAVRLRVRRERQVGPRDHVVQPADAHVRVPRVRHVHRSPAPAALRETCRRLADRAVGRRRLLLVRLLFVVRRRLFGIVQVARPVREIVPVRGVLQKCERFR